jgi:hypothetical protein
MSEDIEESRKQRNIAMLIDGDNAQPSLIREMIRETEKHGFITIRRIYGDWTMTNMHGWKEPLHENAIQPVQQFRNTIGKNATDSAMIIDAMDILHAGLVEGFCLVSSDSDYTRLATRIREKGTFVMGIGKETTPEAFVNACDLFVFTENIVSARKAAVHKEPVKAGTGAEKTSEARRKPLIPLMIQAFEMTVHEDEWVHLANLGTSLRKIDPGFDPRTYGHKQLVQLVKALPDVFEIKKSDKGPGNIYVRLKENARK